MDKNKQVGSSVFGFQEDMTLAVICTEEIKGRLFIIDNTGMPSILMDYNSTMGGLTLLAICVIAFLCPEKPKGILWLFLLHWSMSLA